VTRVLSALILLPVIVGIIWWLPPVGTLVLALVVLALAAVELQRIARQTGSRAPAGIGTIAAGLLVIALAMRVDSAPVVLVAALVAVAGVLVSAGRADADVLNDAAVPLFPAIYLGLPLGMLVLVRQERGAGALLALLLTLVASDSAQYYAGRRWGRRALAPAISPGKTREGAIAGLIAGAIAMTLLGRFWLPESPPLLLGLAGFLTAGFGILGDLFESALKRGAGVKDASGLIPGHGGILDRIDGLLVAGPVYYVFLRYLL
jgi:phosphatidate cytidylyltransferase